VEYVVFEKNVDVVTVVCNKGFIKVNDTTLVLVLIETMYLPFGNKEYRVIPHIVGIEIDTMLTFPRHKPNDLVKAVNVGLLCMFRMAFQVIAQGINLELQLFGTIFMEVVMLYYMFVIRRHGNFGNCQYKYSISYLV